MDNETEKKVDVMERIVQHKKEIYAGLVAAVIVRIFYRRGYKRGQDDILNDFNKTWCSMIEGFIRGGDEWTK